MTRNGTPIELATISGAVRTGIKFNMSFAEYEACVAANLDYWEWEYGTKYSRDFKVRVLAAHRLGEHVKSHTQDAIARKMKRSK